MSIAQYDHLPALVAARLAWTQPGRHYVYHKQMQDQVRRDMPLLARALDRAQREAEQHGARKEGAWR